MTTLRYCALTAPAVSGPSILFENEFVSLAHTRIAGSPGLYEIYRTQVGDTVFLSGAMAEAMHEKIKQWQGEFPPEEEVCAYLAGLMQGLHTYLVRFQ